MQLVDVPLGQTRQEPPRCSWPGEQRPANAAAITAATSRQEDLDMLLPTASRASCGANVDTREHARIELITLEVLEVKETLVL